MKRTDGALWGGQEFNRGAFSLTLIAALAVTAGCSQLDRPFGPRDTSTTAGASAQAATEVEAPEVFQVTAQALWDGRPSLGGVWVAAPNVTDPERVVIRHVGTGAEVVGALFRRERENPGPPIQVSSDAAAALGLLAGQPAQLNITALRTVEAPAAPAAATPQQAKPDAAPAPAATGGAMLQVATLASQAAADSVVARLRAEGLAAEVRQRQSGERTFYRVLTGPADGAEDRATLQQRVRALGYADAFFLST